jgi:[protein-PII] uridylyltransferase
VSLARALVRRLDLGAAAEEEIALLVGDAGLLRGAAARVDGLEEERVVQLATHLDTPERARALYLLTLALGDLEPWDRERLDQLLALILVVLDRPTLSGLEARNLVERRRAEAARLTDGSPGVTERIEHAPRAYLLAQDSADVARQVALLEPLPGRDAARVAVTPLEADEWRVEVALRDRPGLLATVSGVLADHGLDVLDAVVATWADGGALESFQVRRALLEPSQLDDERIRAAGPPEPGWLTDAIARALDRPVSSPPNPDAEVTFDDVGSPWYTLAEVRSPDRRGLLHTITVGLASGGADVHSARLVTSAGRAVDRFELTDRNGRKLDDETKAAIVAAVTGGVEPRRFGRRRLTRRR